MSSFEKEGGKSDSSSPEIRPSNNPLSVQDYFLPGGDFWGEAEQGKVSKGALRLIQKWMRKKLPEIDVNKPINHIATQRIATYLKKYVLESERVQESLELDSIPDNLIDFMIGFQNDQFLAELREIGKKFPSWFAPVLKSTSSNHGLNNISDPSSVDQAIDQLILELKTFFASKLKEMEITLQNSDEP